MVAGETPATEGSAVGVSPTANSTTFNAQYPMFIEYMSVCHKPALVKCLQVYRMQQTNTPVQFIQHTDLALLDAYSKTITGVVHTVSEAVVHIEVTKKMTDPGTKQERIMPGSGSGFLFRLTGLSLPITMSLKMPWI